MPVLLRQIGLARLILLLCLVIALTHPVYCERHCRGNLLPKLCFMHPGKRNSQIEAIQTDQRDDNTEKDNMQLLSTDSATADKMEAIVSLLLGPLEEEKDDLYPDVVQEDSLSRSDKDRILRLLFRSRNNLS